MADDGRRAWRVQSQPVSTSGIPAAASADDRAVTAERCAAQLLCGDRAGSPEEVARRLLAIQAQDPRGARLAIRARSAGLSASDVDSALTRRSMIVTWLNRGTLHLVRMRPVLPPRRRPGRHPGPPERPPGPRHPAGPRRPAPGSHRHRPGLRVLRRKLPRRGPDRGPAARHPECPGPAPVVTGPSQARAHHRRPDPRPGPPRCRTPPSSAATRGPP